MKELAAETLRSLLGYDPATGIFRWRVRPSKHIQSGAVAGKTTKYGYRSIKIHGCGYLAHRLAWLYTYGEWPSLVDHIDGDKANNVIANLRIATPSENGANSKRSARNKSGYKGVVFCSRSQKWRAFIMVDCRVYQLGLHSTPEEAHVAYCDAARGIRGEFARVA